ncbi:trypsin-like peptidase domain-containing protein [Actinomadura sp. 9N215]|uniref:nSTAND1 domain-containing NTPase n=1 Tax=Actinomadura sp. 9N215 TaxID=3375150 RepID=UPI0037ADB319
MNGRTLHPSIARIHSERGAVIGTGFLVGPRHVLTCAHVVAAALGASDRAAEAPDGPILVDFPLLGVSRMPLAGTVAAWSPVAADGGGDIAGLLLEATAPDGAEPVQLMDVEEPWGLVFRTFGFPRGSRDGDWAGGVLADVQATGWLQIESRRQTGRRVQPGYSGAPVWIEALQGVGGMVVAADQGGADRVAYVIPTGTLVAAWPELLEELAVPPTPYRGLNAFRPADRDLFFGRDELVERLVETVAARPLTALVGASGSGKSSIANAGVIARISARPDWRVVELRPRRDPFGELAAVLLPLLEPGLSRLELLDRTPQLAEMLRHGRTETVLRTLFRDGPPNLLIVVDQLEELYTHGLAAPEQQRFISDLLGPTTATAAELGGRLHVLVTLRADFLTQAIADPGFTDALRGAIEPVGPMRRAQLREAVEGPARLRGVRFEPGLVDRILGDVGEEPGRLPLLEFTLTRLWDEQGRRRMTHAVYDAFGGVAGALTHYAEQEYSRFGPDERERARRIFVQLVLPGEDKPDTRRLAEGDDLSAEDWEVVRRLADRRLVVTGGDAAAGRTVELAHETLIQEWARLREWIAADRDFRIWQERVRDGIRLWRAFEGDQAVLLRGSLLVEAETWLADRPGEVSAEERAFIEASRERQEREDAQYKRLYEEAMARQLVAQAELVRGHRPNDVPLSVLLAVESLRRLPSFEADYTLRRALALMPLRTTPLRHELPVQIVVFGPDGRTMLTAGDDAVARIWDTATGAELLSLRHLSYIRTAAFSPDGSLLATGGEDEKARLWSLPDGRELAVMPHDAWVGAIAFGPDGAVFATGCDDGRVRLFDGGSEPFARMEHDGWVRSVAFAPDGSTLLTASGDRTARLWDTSGWSETARLEHDAAVLTAVFDGAGERVATGDESGAVRIWRPGTDPLVLRHDAAVNSVAFDSAGTLLASGSADGSARLWHTGTGSETLRLQHDAPVRSVVFDGGGTRLATAGDDGTGRVWDAHRGAELVRMCHDRAVRAIRLSPDGRLGATAGEEGLGALWTAEAHAELYRSPFPGLTALAAGPDVFAVAGADGDVAVRSLSDGSGARSLRLGEPVLALAFSADGAWLAASGAGGAVRAWRLSGDDGGIGSRDFSTAEPARVLAFGPEGTALAGGGEEGAIRVWSFPDGVPALDLDLGQYVSALSFAPNGASLAAAGDENTVHVWSLPDGLLTAQHVYEHEWLGVAALCPDLSRVASVGERGRVRTLDLTTGSPLAGLDHGSWVTAAAFSADGALLATVGEDGTARVWDAAGAEVCRLPHDGPVAFAAFAGYGSHLVTAGRGEGAGVWPLRPADLIAQARGRLLRELTPAEWRRYLGSEPYPAE